MQELLNIVILGRTYFPRHGLGTLTGSVVIGGFPTFTQDPPPWYPQRALIIPNSAEYTLSIVSEPAVAQNLEGV
jgi:hypothetical protein